jgi:hypothetical protein
MVEIDPDIWQQLHKMVLLEGLEISKMCEWVNSRLLSKGVKPVGNATDIISVQSMYNHFKSHVTDPRVIEDVAQYGFAFVTDTGAADTRAMEAEQAMKLAKLNDFQKMYGLVDAAFTRLTDFDAELSKPGPDGKPKVLNLDEIQTFQKLIKESMAMKKELLNMHNSNEVAGSALQEAVEGLVKVVLDRLQSVLLEVKSSLVVVLPGSTLPDEVVALVKGGIGDAIKTNVPEILASIEKRYRIK